MSGGGGAAWTGRAPATGAPPGRARPRDRGAAWKGAPRRRLRLPQPPSRRAGGRWAEERRDESPVVVVRHAAAEIAAELVIIAP